MQPIRSRRVVTTQQPATDLPAPRRWVPIDEVIRIHEEREARRAATRQERYRLIQVPPTPPRPSRTRRWDREEERNA